MARQIKIKDIAQMAGVSTGTVDRVLHNRGKVSKASREAVEAVLATVDYNQNIHTSAVALRRGYRIVITIPTAVPGEYWDSVGKGVTHALKEYSDVHCDCVFVYYNQFDAFSCRTAFASILSHNPDAVIIGPTFRKDTEDLCAELDSHNIAYSFVDSVIEGTNPVSSFTTNQYSCGYLLANVLKAQNSRYGTYILFRSSRTGNERSNNSYEKLSGFMDYFRQEGLSDKVHEISFSVTDPEDCREKVANALAKYPDLIGVATTNSRGYVVADILKQYGRQDIRLVSFDLTDNNLRCMKDDMIKVILCQHPMLQSFCAVKSLLEWLLYRNKPANSHRWMPIDIVTKENLPYYRDILDI